MKIGLLRPICSLAIFLAPTARSADESTSKIDAFAPYELVGDWHFTNSTSGRKYGGDVKVTIDSIDGAGVMRGKVSYDGRQTNDMCSTRGVFSDDPVPAEIIKADDSYRISFMVNCVKGQSPRLRSWTLVCENGICSRPEVLPHGSGRLALKEKR